MLPHNSAEAEFNKALTSCSLSNASEWIISVPDDNQRRSSILRNAFTDRYLLIQIRHHKETSIQRVLNDSYFSAICSQTEPPFEIISR